MKSNGFLVTWDELATLGATLVNPSNPAPTGNKIVTKEEGLTYYNFQTSPLSSYTDNQCPPYEAWVVATPSPTTAAPTTASPTTAAPTTAAPTTAAPTTAAPTTAAPTTAAPTTAAPTTAAPTTAAPTTAAPTTAAPTTAAPTTAAPTTAAPTTAAPTTAAPTTAAPTTAAPTTAAPTTASPTPSPTTAAPTTAAPTTAAPTTAAPTTAAPTTAAPTTAAPTGTPSTVNIHLEEYNASPITFLDANLTVNGTTYYFSGDFSTTVPAGTSNNVTLEAAEATPSNIWGPYTTASALLSIYEDSILIHSSSNTYYSGSGSQNFSHPVTYSAGKTYVISGSTVPNNSCYSVNFTVYTVGECYFYPNEYEANQSLTVILDAPASTDVRVSGSFSDDSPFDTIIPAGFSSVELLGNTCGCPTPCLSGTGINYISVTTNSGNTILSECSGGGGESGFRSLFPTGSLFLNNVAVDCSLDKVYFNLTGGIAPYSASVTQDANGNPIWTYLNIPTIYTASVTANQIYYPAIADSTGTVVAGQTLYKCVTNEITFMNSPLRNGATGQLTQYIYILQNPAVNRPSPYTVTGSFGSVINMGCAGTNGSIFKGWSYSSGSTAGIFSTESIIQVPFTGTGSIIYALLDKNSVSSSFCYYNSDPIGTTACDACAVISTVYMNGDLLIGSTSYTNINWYSNSSLTTLVPAGYYKLTSNTKGISNPIYQVSAGPTQTKTLIGFCNDTILTC